MLLADLADRGPEQPAGAAPAQVTEVAAPADRFQVRLDNFTGPFDLLLVADRQAQARRHQSGPSQVTDEFIAYITARGRDWELDEATEFLLVAATLLDLKAARLLPAGEVEDEDDLALLEARDLLFARLLQYRAYKEVAALLSPASPTSRTASPARSAWRSGTRVCYPSSSVGPARVRAASGPSAEAQAGAHRVGLAPARDRGSACASRRRPGERLRRVRGASFRALTSDCPSTLHVVGRFLALLELYRERVVSFDQLTPFGELSVRWTGDDEGYIEVGDEFDEESAVQSDDQAEEPNP